MSGYGVPVQEAKRRALEIAHRRYGSNISILAASDVTGYGAIAIAPQPLGPWGGLFIDFAAALEALFGRRVDVIMPQSIRNPYFRQAIDVSRRLVMKLETKELVFEPWMAALAFGSCPFQIFSKLFQ